MLGYIISDKNEINVKNYEIKILVMNLNLNINIIMT